MRCNWRRWLWGVIPLVGVSVAAVHLERGAIEKDLADRAKLALAGSGSHWADVNFSGRDVVLTGNATAENEPPEAEAVLLNLWGVRHVNNNAGLPPRVEPFLWYATRRGDRLRLHGHVPNRATRQAIMGMATAALPGLEVVDRMRIARGVPPTDTWLAGLSFALKQLAALKKGEVRLEDLALTVSGEAESAAEYRTVIAALKAGLPKGITLAGVQVAAPVVSPYTWSAQFAGGQLVLSGHVAGDSAKTELLAAAASAPSGMSVIDRLETARGAPADFASAAATLIRQIVNLQTGNAEMKDTAVTVGGIAADEAQAQAVREALRASMPPAFKVTDQIRVREPPKVEPKVELKTELKAEAKVEAQPPVGPMAPAQTEQHAAAAATSSKADMQPAAAVPAPAAAPAKLDAPSEAKVAAESPSEAQSTAPAGPPPAPAAAESAKEVVPPKEVASGQQVAPAKEEVAPVKEAAPPTAAPPAEPQTKVAASALPSAPERAAASVSPSLPDPPAAAPAAPAVPTNVGSASAASAAAIAKTEPAPPSAGLAVCRDDLAKLAAANAISFERGSANLDEAGLDMLARIAAAVKVCPGVRIAAEGHTDIEGGPDYNRRLSIKRARVVAACLIKAGVGTDQVETAGFGSSRPAAPNTSVQARAKNRRTEIVVRPE